ncbi:helix-turn-helix transcriptional regulator [Methanolobus chelungpuianus]|uniref:Transcriptional regulator n=1 Tax=Methanolobus chelungpuianus TaxID=502115 RepID=A0AAE3KXC9_9EURY|nr:winged helix-turn-helix domain-containing protein [Methanolobus chelungpuianus]MCQ6963035.1 transcriptional regulator [Methanolobus chelungpuianus]
MKKTMVDVIFMSEKRKNTLLLLQDGPKEMEYLLNSLDTTRTALLPQIKVLEDHYLVSHKKDIYQLTTVGRLIVNDMSPLINTIEVLDMDIDYWESHDLEFIPHSFLERIDELRSCKVLSPTIAELFEINKDFVKSASKSSHIYLLTTIMHPEFPSLLSEFIKDNRKVTMIVTRELYARFTQELYDSFKGFIAHGGVRFFIYQGDLRVTTLSITDSCFILRLLSKNKDFSYKQLLCNDPRSYQWSRDLFDHYLGGSIPITEV